MTSVYLLILKQKRANFKKVRQQVQQRKTKRKFMCATVNSSTCRIRETQHCSSFNGAGNNVFKSENEFDTLGETKFDVTLAFEEDSYSFAARFRYDFSSTTDGDFKTVQKYAELSATK